MKRRAHVITATLLMLLLACACTLVAQDEDYAGHTHAISEAESRAEREAEEMVSLPAEKIIVLLEREPGLSLQVKKMLVRKAYQQGRILGPNDLTDDAVYHLVRTDQTVRVWITQEIIDRQYIRARPTQQELQREWQQRQLWAAAANSRQAAPEIAATQNREQPYGSQQQGQRNLPEMSTPPGGPGFRANPPSQPPQNAPVNDQRRQLLQAQAQLPNVDVPQGLPLDVLGMQQSNADQMSSMLADGGIGSPSVIPAKAAATEGMGSETQITGGGAPLLDPPATLPDFGSDNSDISLQPQAKLAQPNYRTPPRLQNRRNVQEQPALLRRANPYADVPSLYDLYSQYSRHTPVLARFGTDVFENGTGNFDQLPMDLPVGPDYVLGPGDGVDIDLWGSFSQRLKRAVDSQGRLDLPEIGGIQVAGHTLGDVQHLVQSALRTQFRDLEADVSLSRMRSIRVYVVGDVQNPGAYDVSSLSTPLNALYQAGGPTARGSMRIVKHFRGNQLIETVDLYDLLLHGVQSSMQRLQSGDTILVPPIGVEVTVEGMVRRPAIYELNGETSLAQVLQLAGGVLPSGTLRHVDVQRVVAHQSRTMLGLDIPENNNQESVTEALEKFGIQDGDTVKISPILPFSDKTVYLEGHVFRPGKYAYHEGMKVSDLIKSYNDLLPEPYKRHAEIVRLKAPDYTPEILAFNLADALAGKDQDLVLKPFDTLRIFGRYDFEDPPVITISGAVRDPGDHVTNGATHLRDAIYLAGNATADADLSDVQVFRTTTRGKLEVLSVNLAQALAGSTHENILLQPKDRVFVHKDLARTDPATVTIEGEVARPGKYPLGENMTATQLVRLAGGLKRSAYPDHADLTRYVVDHGNRISGEQLNVQLAAALAGSPDSDVRLHDGDVLTVRRVAGWNDIGATIEVDGEVVHPGTYGIRDGERLSSILSRAGGFGPDAYPYGAVLERAQVRELEEQKRSDLIQQVQQEGTNLKSIADDPTSKEASLLQWQSTLKRLQSTPPVGRLVVHISGDVKHWANTPSDIQVRAGDVLYVPKKPNFVMVDGAVYNQTAITFRPGKTTAYYLHLAGGPTAMADKKGIFVIRADGTVAGGKGGLFNGGALDAELRPGDMVVVPDKAFGGGFKWRNTLQIAQLVSAAGIAVQVAKGF